MNHLFREMPIILEENGGTEDMLYQKKKVAFKVPQWTDFYDSMTYHNGTPIYVIKNLDPVYLLIHGAGFSAMSFALLAKEIRKFGSVVAYDLIQHGNSSRNEQLTSTNLQQEAQLVLDHCSELFPATSVIVVGHSLGGALACKLKFGKNVQGLVVIDTCEDKAVASFPTMECILRQRPKNFLSLQSAINYHLNTGTLKNAASAHISVPYCLNGNLEWKVDLLTQAPYWKQWFEGMNAGFEQFEGGKMMIFSDYDRVNPEQQRTSKYPIHILSESGHNVHEDEPNKTAKHLNLFVYAQRIPINQVEMKQKEIEGIFKFRPKIKDYLIV